MTWYVDEMRRLLEEEEDEEEKKEEEAEEEDKEEEEEEEERGVREDAEKEEAGGAETTQTTETTEGEAPIRGGGGRRHHRRHLSVYGAFSGEVTGGISSSATLTETTLNGSLSPDDADVLVVWLNMTCTRSLTTLPIQHIKAMQKRRRRRRPALTLKPRLV